MKRPSFGTIMGEYGAKRDYVWLYGPPSALIHGLEGIRTLIETHPDGTEEFHLTFPLEQANAMLVDVGGNVLMFCEHFIRRYKPNDEGIVARHNALRRMFHRFVLKHRYGRDADGIAAVEQEIVEMDAATRAMEAVGA